MEINVKTFQSSKSTTIEVTNTTRHLKRGTKNTNNTYI